MSKVKISPPRGFTQDSRAFTAFYNQIQNALDTQIVHNNLDGLQGGDSASSEYYHLTLAQNAALGNLGAFGGNLAMVTDAAGNIAESTVTTTELDALLGIDSNIQTQLDGKEPTITGAATTVTSANLTVDRALISNALGKIAVHSSVSTVELGYIDGLLSNAQAQIDKKLFVSDTGGNSAWDDMLNGGVGRITNTGTGFPSVVQVNSGAYALDFDDAALANEKRVLYDPQMTHGVKAGSEFRLHAHFLPSTIPGATQVSQWEVSYTTFDNPGDLSSAGRLNVITCYIPIYTTDIQYGYIIRPFYTSNTTFDDTTKFKITNANMQRSSIYSITIRRKSSVAGDTYTGGSVYVLAFDGHIEINRRGTATEYT